MINESSKILIETHTISPQQQPIRLSGLQAGTFASIPSRKGFKNAIKKGLVNLNKEIAKTSDFVCGGELVEIYQAKETAKPTIDLQLEVIFEDDYLAVVNKPSGITVSGNKKWTLENALSFNLKKSTQTDALIRPEPVHRLDHPTSGALLVSKTSSALARLNRMFEIKTIKKTYLAITSGKMPAKGKIDSLIDGKDSETNYEVLNSVSSDKYESLNLVKLSPLTGRRHQLRIHMAGQGTPVVGDREYGKEGKILQGKGLFLHSLSLCFIHPVTSRQLLIEAKIPPKFNKLIASFKTIEK